MIIGPVINSGQALTSIGGGYGAMADNTFGSADNLILAGIVLAVIVLLNRQKNRICASLHWVLAMTAGLSGRTVDGHAAG